MFSQHSHSIVLITFDCVTRIDLQSRKAVEVTHCSSVPRSELADLADSVRAGLGLGAGPNKPGRVYVLTDEIWAGQVALPADTVRALQPEELENTLALQAEQQSGISPFESRSGHALISADGDQTTWWVAQTEFTQLDQITAAMGKAADRLAVVSSIATLPSLSDRCETEILHTVSAQQCQEFAVAWLTRYLSQPDALAIIGIQQDRVGAQAQRAGILAAALALLVCITLHLLGAYHLSNARAELATFADRETRLRTELDQREAYARESQAAEQQRVASEALQTQQRAAIRLRQAQHAARRERPVQLLRALAVTADPGHCIQVIDLNADGATVSGVAAETQAVTSLAQRLDAELSSSQWVIRAAEISISETTGLVQFKMLVAPRNSSVSPLNVASSGVTDAR